MSDGEVIGVAGALAMSEPAKVLVEKVCNAVGVLYEPTRIRRAAAARAEEMVVLAQAENEIADARAISNARRELRLRALDRFVQEEERKQANMEAVLAIALENLNEDAPTDQVDDDWLANIFDKCRLTSDTQMQQLWSKILTGEGNSPGKFSKRTVNLVASLEKSDAESFALLANYCWEEGGRSIPLIYNVADPVYAANNLNFSILMQLDAAGLIRYSGAATYNLSNQQNRFAFVYFQQMILIQHRLPFETGHALLTKSGQELISICERHPIPEFQGYVESEIRRQGGAVYKDRDEIIELLNRDPTIPAP